MVPSFVMVVEPSIRGVRAAAEVEDLDLVAAKGRRASFARRCGRRAETINALGATRIRSSSCSDFGIGNFGQFWCSQWPDNPCGPLRWSMNRKLPT